MKYQKADSSADSGRRRRGRKRGRRRKVKSGDTKEPAAGDDREDLEPKAKRGCHEHAVTEEVLSKSDESAESTTIDARKTQLVLGTNAFTRCLEEGNMRVGVVCLSAKPALLHKHLLQLSAVRRVPVAALPNLSPSIAPLLGLKSTLAIGIKVATVHLSYHYRYIYTMLQGAA